MNKILTFALLALFGMSGCQKEKSTDEPRAAQTQSTDKDLVRINYDNKINGYEVNVIWKPKNERYGNISGPAILEFKKEDVNFTVTNNYFSLPTEAFESVFTITDGLITDIKEYNFTLSYIEPDLSEGKFEIDNPTPPFLFVDLNFDDKKELLITKAGQGQRDIDAFDVYALDSSGDLEPSYAQITNQEPYNEMDAWVTINRKNKELIFYGSGGVCNDSWHIYSWTYDDYEGYKLALTKIIQGERDDDAGKCYELTYSVQNGIKRLISKKEIDQ